MKYNPRIKNLKPFLNANGQLASFRKITPELKYRCVCCEGQFTDAQYTQSSGDYTCLICREAEWKAEQNITEPAPDSPSPAINIAQLNAEDFQFVIFRQDGKPWSLKSAFPNPQKMEFCDLHSLFNNPVTPKKIFQQVCRNTEEIYRQCFFQSLHSDLPATKSKTDDSPEHRAIVAFKRLVAGTQPGTIDPSYVKKLDVSRRWLWIGAVTKEALPEETLLRNFFYYHCFENGADYPSAIRLYRRLEPMETLMKLCLSKDKWLDERDKNLRFLGKNPLSKPAAPDIASGVG